MIEHIIPIQAQKGFGLWPIRMRKKLCKTLYHFPLFQPFIHIAYFLELIYHDLHLKMSFENHVTFSKRLISREYTGALSDHHIPIEKKMLLKIAKKVEKIKTHRTYLIGQFMDLKLYEAFLEGGPQSIVQLMIVMQGGLTSYFQIFTIVTSLLSFTLAASEIYLRYPTKV